MKTPFISRGLQPSRPHFELPGFEALIDALNRLGRVKFGDKWSSLEWYARDLDRITADQEKAKASDQYERDLRNIPAGDARSIASLARLFLTPLHPVRNDHFTSDEAEIEAASRAVAIWHEARTLLYEQKIAVVGLSDAGTKISIPSSAWAASDAHLTVSTGRLTTGMGDALRMAWVHVRSVSLDKVLAKPPSQLYPKSPASRAALRDWYSERIEHLLSNGSYSSRDQDCKAAKEKFSTASRAEVLALRRSLAPASWQNPGRPTKLDPKRRK